MWLELVPPSPIEIFTVVPHVAQHKHSQSLCKNYNIRGTKVVDGILYKKYNNNIVSHISTHKMKQTNFTNYDI